MNVDSGFPKAAPHPNRGRRRCRVLRPPLLAIAWACVLVACATVEQEPAPPIRVSGLVIHNQGTAFVGAVRLLVPATGQFVSCGSIAPGARCAVAFPAGEWSGNPVEITWSAAGHIWSTGAMNPQPGEDVLEAGSAVVEVVIAGPSAAGVSLVADR